MPESYREIEGALFHRAGRSVLLMQNASASPQTVALGGPAGGASPTLELLAFRNLMATDFDTPKVAVVSSGDNSVDIPAFSILRAT